MTGTYGRSAPRARSAVSVLRNLPIAPPVVRRVRREALTMLREDALNDLWRATRNLESDGVKGDIIEAGCARGGSALVLAAAKSRQRALQLYDTFGLIPPPSDADGPDVHDRYAVISSGQAKGKGERDYYGYVPDLLAEVTQSFVEFGLAPEANNISFHQGLFADTIAGDSPVALAHIDGDWYDSVMVCLDRIAPRLVPGGLLVIDDYEAWSGCQRAVDDFLVNRASEFAVSWKSRLHLQKK